MTTTATATPDAPETPMMNATAPTETPRPAPAAQSAPAFPIVERDRRRPEFKADYGAMLADGQRWFARKPRTWMNLRRFPDGTRRLAQMYDFGDGRFKADAEYQARVDELLASEDQPLTDPGVIERRIFAQLDLAGDLLKRNYILSDDEADALVAFDFSAQADPAQVIERDGLLIIAQGLIPYAPAEPGPDAEPTDA